jgi:hypothetical protein
MVNNKSWDYVVSYVDPIDLEDRTPAQRGELTVKVSATTVPRAISKAKVLINEEWEGLESSQIVIVDCRRADK